MPRVTPLDRYRNIGIMAHIDAGKTTTTERILYYTGRSYKIGEVHEGTATMDWMEQEQERGITITSAATTCFWRDSPHQYHRYARPCRLHHRGRALACACSTARWRCSTPSRASSRNPRRCGARPTNTACRASASSTRWTASAPISSHCVEMIDRPPRRQAAGASQLPIGAESEFAGIIDLVAMKALIWLDEDAWAPSSTSVDIPGRHGEAGGRIPPQADRNGGRAGRRGARGLSRRQGARRRATLINASARAPIAFAFVPVLCGSAFKNKGVQPLLDAVVDYLPAPTDMPPIKGVKMDTRRADRRAALRRRALRRPRLQDHERPLRRLADLRAGLFGRADQGHRWCSNSVKGKRERIGRMLLMHANHREDIKEARAGDIVALRRPQEHHHRRHAVRSRQARSCWSGWSFPSRSSRSRSSRRPRPTRKRWARRWQRLATGGSLVPRRGRPGERPDHHQGHGRAASRDHRRPHEARVQGRGQCRRAAGGLPRDHHARTSEIDYTHKKQTGGSGQFARVKIRSSRCRRAPASSSRTTSSAAPCPRNTSPASRRACKARSTSGVLAGFPVIDFKATLYDGAYHDVDSSALAFEIAARAAFKEGMQKAGPQAAWSRSCGSRW